MKKTYKRLLALCLVFTLVITSFSANFTSDIVFANETVANSTTTAVADITTATDSTVDGVYQTISKTENISAMTWIDWDSSATTVPNVDSTIIDGSRSVNLKMTSDIALNASLYIKSGAVVNLDLNGFDLSLAKGTDDKIIGGSVIVCEGTLNIYDSGTAVNEYEISDSETYKFTGGTITGGSTDGSTYNNHVGNIIGGGGILMRSGTLNMFGGTVIGNETLLQGTEQTSQGGGIYIASGATFNMHGGAVSYNSAAANAGGIYSLGTFNMTDGCVSYNSTKRYGGGLYIVGDSKMSGGTITANTAEKGAAGVSVVGKFELSGGKITNNTTTGGGGGVLLGDKGYLIMTGGEISGNSAGNGGGVSMTQETCTLDLSGGTITNNTASYNGGGVFFNKGTLNVSDEASVSGNKLTNETDNNVFIVSGKQISVTGELHTATSYVGVTYQDGLGTVANGYSDDSSKQINSDNANYFRIVTSDGHVELIDILEIEGENQTKAYTASGIDISNIGLFAASDLESGYVTYSITQKTGKGTLGSDGKTLDVESCGDFDITVKVAKSSDGTQPPKIGTAVLTVTPLEITLTAISAIGRAVEEGNDKVELNQSGYTLSGIQDGDSVILDFSDAYGKLSGTGVSDSGTKLTYSITVHGLKLAGKDSGNYTLADIYNDNGTSTLTVAPTVSLDTSTPFFAWPAATDITYGELQSVSTLTGGKVVVKLATQDNGADVYKDITEYGSFQWKAAETDVQDAGVYSKEVSFVLTEDSDDLAELKNIFASDDEYTAVSTALVAQIHYVSYEVLPAAVTFAIEGNVQTKDNSTQTSVENLVTITAKSEIATDTLTADDFGVIYFYYDSDDKLVYDAKTIDTSVVDTYLIGAEFFKNSNGLYNYHHSGISDSIAKQIGAYYVTAGNNPTEYNVTFTNYSNFNTTGYADDIHILPTIEGESYIGWEKADGTFYDFGSRYPQTIDATVTFTAVTAPTKSTLSGKVSGTDLDTTNRGLSQISIYLMQGAKLVATAITNASGDFSFNVPQGKYTLVAMRDLGSITNTKSIFVDFDSTNAKISIELPNIRQNTVLNIDAGFTGITADGIEKLIGDEDNTVNINVDQVNIYSSAYSQILDEAYKNGLTTNNIKLFFDIYGTEQPASEKATTNSQDNIELLANGEILSLENFGDGLTFFVPLAGIYQNKDTYTLYVSRGDETSVWENKETSASDTQADSVEYFEVVGSNLIIHAKEPGLFALAFENTSKEVVGGELDDVTYSEDVIDVDSYVKTILGESYEQYKDSGYTIQVSDSTGKSVFNSKDNTLRISKVGDFNISVIIPENKVIASDNESPRELIITSTLTVDPAEVTVSGIAAESRGFVSSNYNVDLVADTGFISGIINGDSVSINLVDNAKGEILESLQTDYITLKPITELSTYFDIEIDNEQITLGGDDASNYTLKSVANSYVVIQLDKVYISWPTVKDVTYGTTLNNNSLYGGKVIVAPINDSANITVDGSFEWVTSPTKQDAGSYTDTVKFVVSESDTIDYSYINNIEHEVSYNVKALAVEFSVKNSTCEIGTDGSVTLPTITATDELKNVLTVDTDYKISYRKLTDEAYVEVDTPDGIGAYTISAEFINKNYHHSGTSENAGKQISAFYVYQGEADKPESYTLTFDVGGDTEKITPIVGQLQDIHILPSIYSDASQLDTNYIGWEKQDGTFYAYGARFPQNFKGDTTLYAVEAPETIKVSGTITGTELGSTSTDVSALSDIAVAIMQGSVIIDTTETDDDGTYTFNVSEGRYTIVVSRDQVVSSGGGTEIKNTISKFVLVEKAAIDVEKGAIVIDITITDTVQNTTLNVDSGVGSITVDGMDDFIIENQSSSTVINVGTVDTVAGADAELDKVQSEASSNGLTTDNLKIFYKINIESLDSDLNTYFNLSELNQPGTASDDMKYLDFYIPLAGAYQGMDNYEVYRYHNGAVDILTTTPNADGEYIAIVDSGATVLVHACKFSLYGIAFYDNLDSLLSSSTGIKLDFTYDINFDLDGGTCDTEAFSASKNSCITLPSDAKKDGFEFVGWLDNKTDTIYHAGDSFTVSAQDVSFTAIWKKIASDEEIYYNLTFDLATCGSGDWQEQRLQAGDKFTLEGSVATLAYCSFEGFQDSESGKLYQIGDSLIMPSRDVQLLAVYNEIATGENDCGCFFVCYWWIILIAVVILIFIFFIIWKRRKKDEEEELEENETHEMNS